MRSTLIPALGVLILWGLWPLLAKVSVSRLGIQALWWSYWGGLATVWGYLLWYRQRPVPTDGVGLAASLTSGLVVALGSLIFYDLLRRHPASVVAFLTGLYPVVSLLLGWLLFHERPTAGQTAGIALAVAAIALLTR